MTRRASQRDIWYQWGDSDTMWLSSVIDIVHPAGKLGSFMTATPAAGKRMTPSLLLLQGLLTHEREQRVDIVVDGHGMDNIGS